MRKELLDTAAPAADAEAPERDPKKAQKLALAIGLFVIAGGVYYFASRPTPPAAAPPAAALSAGGGGEPTAALPPPPPPPTDESAQEPGAAPASRPHQFSGGSHVTPPNLPPAED